MIDCTDLSYQFDIMETFPSFHFKELESTKPRNKKINAKFTTETQSKITRLVAPFLDKEMKNNYIYNIN